MTVDELIEELQKYSGHTTVRVIGDSAVVRVVETNQCYGCGRPEVVLRG